MLPKKLHQAVGKDSGLTSDIERIFPPSFTKWHYHHPPLPTQIAKLLKRQQGTCPYCGVYFRVEDLWEVHHVDGNHPNHQWKNLTLLHQHCHDQVHSGVHDKHPVVEEPCEVTRFKHGSVDQRSSHPLRRV